MRLFTLLLTLLVSSCSIPMGKIPVIIKKMDADEIDYSELMHKKATSKKNGESKKDCLHAILLVPTKMTLDMKEVFKNSCKKSNYSFDHELRDRFYFLVVYGQECFISEHHCENN